MKGEKLSCKVLSVMMRHLDSFCCFSFEHESLWTLTIHVELGLHGQQQLKCFNPDGQRFYVIHQIMKSNPQDSLFYINSIENNPCSTRKRVNVARGTEVDIRWLKVD